MHSARIVHVGVLGKACRDRPPWVLYHNRDFSVTTGFGCLVSRQGRAYGRCRNKRAPSARQKSSIATDFLRTLVVTESAQPHVATEFHVS